MLTGLDTLSTIVEQTFAPHLSAGGRS
jgi:hypothetical protein